MLRFYFDKRILIGFLLALAILPWLASSSYLNTKALVRSNLIVVRSPDIFCNRQRVLSGVTSIALVSVVIHLQVKENLLKPYNAAKRLVCNILFHNS